MVAIKYRLLDTVAGEDMQGTLWQERICKGHCGSIEFHCVYTTGAFRQTCPPPPSWAHMPVTKSIKEL